MEGLRPSSFRPSRAITVSGTRTPSWLVTMTSRTVSPAGASKAPSRASCSACAPRPGSQLIVRLTRVQLPWRSTTPCTRRSVPRMSTLPAIGSAASSIAARGVAAAPACGTRYRRVFTPSRRVK